MTIQSVNYGALIQQAAQKYGVDPELIQQVIQVESGGNPAAASGTGPVGLMQVSKAVANDYGYSNQDRLDPAKNIDMGARYLAQNLKAFGGDTSKALLGYNQGTGGARQMLNGKIPLAPEGQNYITNPAFRKWTVGGVAPTIQNIANPVAGLEGSKPDNQFSPALLQRDAAQNAPSQADAMAGAATPITLQQAQPALAQNPQVQGDGNGKWGDAALGLMSLLAGVHSNKTVDSQSGVGAGRSGRSNWSPETQRVLQLLQTVGSAPNFRSGLGG